MRNQSLIRALIVVSMLLSTAASANATPVEANSNPAASTNWGLGAGVSYSVYGGLSLTPAAYGSSALSALGALGALGGLGGPSVAAVVERRAGHGWLLLAADLNYDTYDQTDDREVGGATGSDKAINVDREAMTWWQAAISLGWRYVHNQGDRVELSTYGLLSASRYTAESVAKGTDDTTDGARNWTATTTSIGLGGALGITVDARLTESISLRIATPLLVAGRSWTDSQVITEGKGHVDTRSFSGANVGLRLAPRLLLRVGF